MLQYLPVKVGVDTMNACGLIVEYNPFHNGHVYHIDQAKSVSHADCMIAVMSGSFLQRGEPAIIDKYHRTKAALNVGIDIVLELPFVYAVQNSDYFAQGAVQILHNIGVSSICFGSESGDISTFLQSYDNYKKKEQQFNQQLKMELANGLSYPEASKLAYQQIGLSTSTMDLTKPNNILGFSYVKSILDQKYPIEPLTIERSKNQFHDEDITSRIASATSIRKKLLEQEKLTSDTIDTMPEETTIQLNKYKDQNGTWHHWELYFPFLQYRVQSMSLSQLKEVHGVIEGLEHRIKQTANQATSFYNWIELIKTKRYTWTRLQRIFAHILIHSTKDEILPLLHSPIPYIRILGFNQNGKRYLNKVKKDLSVPIVTNFRKNMNPLLHLEERASQAYYSILDTNTKRRLFQQELTAPIIM